MDIPIFPTDAPLKPRDEIRIEALEVTPYPDRFRVRVHIQVTPFQERPNLLLVAHNEDDRLVSELDIIETMHHDMEFTLHIRGVDNPGGLYTLTADLFYETRQPAQDRRIVTFTIPSAEDEDPLAD
jgi:hypothetical protein